MGVRLVVNGKLYNDSGGSSGGGGTSDHDKLDNRDLENQHPIEAITGLAETIYNYDNNFEDISVSLSEIKDNIASQYSDLNTQSEINSTQDSQIASLESSTSEIISNINSLSTSTSTSFSELKTYVDSQDSSLSLYASTSFSELQSEIDTKQDSLTAGDNIEFQDKNGLKYIHSRQIIRYYWTED